MDKIFDTDRIALEKLMADEAICWGTVERLARTEEGMGYMILMLVKNLDMGIKAGGERCVIYAPEADCDNPNLRLMNLMGRRIPFVICGIDEDKGWLTCSRKRAQELLKTSMLQGLQSGRIYEGEIVGFSRYGGYVEVGGVTGHIRNSDFTTDHSDIREYMKMGDRLEVRCKEISASDGYIFWEAVNKQHRTEPLPFDFEPDTIVLGNVVRIANFGQSTGVFVNLQLGIDALCPMPRDLEIEENSRVSIKIESVTPGKRPTDPPRIRGRIIRVS